MKLNSPNLKPNLSGIQLTGSTWEGTFPDFRKRARQLENEIDAKLLNLNKLSVFANDTLSRSLRLGADSSMDKNLPSKAKIDELCGEIESLLAKLTDINDQMSTYFGPNNLSNNENNQISATNPALLHTMQRHRDILNDYCHEFQRSQANVQQRLERELLFSSNKINNSVIGGGNAKKDLDTEPFNNHRDDDPYLKEHEHIRSSDRLIDQQISIAISTKEHLQSQRSGLHEITKKLHHLSKRYPAISGIMQKINWRKRRDTIILGSVISVCLFIMFIYATR